MKTAKQQAIEADKKLSEEQLTLDILPKMHYDKSLNQLFI